MRGVELEDGPARAVAARFLDDEQRRLLVAIEEGRNRQVRRMMDAIGTKVIKLVRISIGGLRLADLKLPEGEFLEMEGAELLRKILPPKPRG